MVTLDLKEFGSMHVLLIIDSFCRFFQGKVILNKRAETIVRAVIDTWIVCFGIPTVRFYTNNGGELVNIEMHKLIVRLGVTIRYGPVYSLWSNGINEWNQTSCDLTIKKLMEE